MGNSMSSQSLKNLTIFNFVQIVPANSHPQQKQLCKILEKSVKYFSSYTPRKNGNFTPKMGMTIRQTTANHHKPPQTTANYLKPSQTTTRIWDDRRWKRWKAGKPPQTTTRIRVKKESNCQFCGLNLVMARRNTIYLCHSCCLHDFSICKQLFYIRKALACM